MKKVAAQAMHLLPPEGEAVLTGGLCEFQYLRSSLGKALGREVVSSPNGRYAGAIGAALVASKLES